MLSWETVVVQAGLKQKNSHDELPLSACCQLKGDSFSAASLLSTPSCWDEARPQAVPGEKSGQQWLSLHLEYSSCELIFWRHNSFFHDCVKSQRCRTAFKQISGNKKQIEKEIITFAFMIFTEFTYNFVLWLKCGRKEKEKKKTVV